MTGWDSVHRVVFDPDPARASLYVRGGDTVSRTAVQIGDAGEISLAAYFGAFAAAYWFAHTDVRSVRVSGHIKGTATVRVMSTDAHGTIRAIASLKASGEFAHEVPLRADLAWLWLEVKGSSTTILHDVVWAVSHVRTPASVTVAITTFNRNEDCIRLIGRLAHDAGALEVIDAVVVVDQGSQRLAAAPDWDDSVLPGVLHVIEQRNLGGSGGFSRGMLEAARIGSSHVLLLDDDVDLEPESLRRMVDFAAHARGPRVVGAHMLSLIEPTRLHSFGERIDRGSTWWKPVEEALADLDLSAATVDRVPALSRRIDVDFNGWWMCLLPMSVVREHGASLPFFIKWDDAEFGIRAAAAGVGTVTLPGAALWHMPWTAKDDGLDWQAYFQFRNRLVTALLHGGPHVLRASLAQDLNHLLCAQYGSVALRNLALRDVLSGPDHFEPVLEAGPARATAVLARAGQVIRAEQDAPQSTIAERPARPAGAAGSAQRLVRVIVQQFRRPASTEDYVRLSRAEGKWWALGLLDGALVEAAQGNGVFVVRRDRRTAAAELWAAAGLRLRLRWSWRSAARRYRVSASKAASLSTWEARFSQATRVDTVD